VKVTFQADSSSDLAALQIGEYLKFTDVRVRYLSGAGISRLKTWGRLRGAVLGVNLTSTNEHRVEGSAVMVAPGVALCASHVFQGHLDRLMSGELKALCIGPSDHGNELWGLRGINFVPNTDVCILTLTLINGLPTDRTFHHASITTRTPRHGERLFVVAFKAEAEDCENWVEGRQIRMNALICAGEVTQHFLLGRDRVMLPGPAIEVECDSWPGMSGGPVFDDEGWLIGVLSSSVSGEHHDSPSFVSLAISALGHRFTGGWPDPGSHVIRSLLSMSGKGCHVERPESIVASYPDDGASTKYVYTIWQTR